MNEVDLNVPLIFAAAFSGSVCASVFVALAIAREHLDLWHWTYLSFQAICGTAVLVAVYVLFCSGMPAAALLPVILGAPFGLLFGILALKS